MKRAKRGAEKRKKKVSNRYQTGKIKTEEVRVKDPILDCTFPLSHLICPSTARVAGAPQMISQPVSSSIF